MEDSKIVDLYWARDERAITETSVKYSRYLKKVAFNILADNGDCEECENDTYMRAWNAMPDDRPELLSSYLARIIRNLAIDIFRKRNSMKRKDSEYALSIDELDEMIPSGSTVEQEVEGKLLSGAISDFLRTRKAEKRNIFISRYFYCDAIKDIAENAGMKEVSVRSVLLREREALREYLKKEGFAV
ncbi:MAG: sigma-70 family RNA polymerase sigma factor [Lachnospiraceae bacterium]|nr:sigma-70 family RNA polymerase sigma factor [Lachnospiraceae bacterium]